MPDLSRYADHVPHPRYGRSPRFTPVGWDDVRAAHRLGVTSLMYLEPSWHGEPVPGTWVLADWRRQAPATFHCPAYVDVDIRCRDCGRRFLFFAEEQRHLYEELKLNLATRCVRCADCRRRVRRGVELANRYERSTVGTDRTAAPADLFAGAAAGVRLVERGDFGPKAAQRVRAALNRLRNDAEFAPAAARLRGRLDRIET